jgi:hypothetical protein
MKSPKYLQNPKYRQPVTICDPGSFDKLKPRIQFDLLDFDDEYWGWDHLSKAQHIEFLKFIHSIEKITWAEIKETAGGKNKGTNHHSLEIGKFSSRAKLRIQKLNFDFIVGDTLFSLRINNLTRLYGVREEAFFRPIWYDPFHADPKKAAYPVKK